ncbi:DUF7260 family protein [Halosimplex carlsbadense]|uniref:DUF7260 family protein n=1 Tax=Halosimplex carlsbadense TaxID=171164 RepID=UPI000677A24E|nr:hypothetical protein [Halosimplex carlsbadense]
METSRRADDPVVRSLRDHVLEPLSTATEIVDREHAEVEAERRAFARFGDRVAGIETETPSASEPGQRQMLVDTPSNRTERLRSAFRESVMSVDHYEERYGESLVEHVAAELTADVAAGFRRNSGAAFTEFYKSTLTSAVANAVDGRERLCDQLDGERSSLEASRRALDDLVENCGGPWSETATVGIEPELDEIAQQRQALVQRRDPVSGTDGHDLCDYVYGNADWTYPVLTAITRFRTAVV